MIMERSGSMERSAPLMELKRGQRSCSGFAPVNGFARSWEIWDHHWPLERWQIPALTASWQIPHPSPAQGRLCSSFQDRQREGASCISTPHCFMCHGQHQKLLRSAQKCSQARPCWHLLSASALKHRPAATTKKKHLGLSKEKHKENVIPKLNSTKLSRQVSGCKSLTF